MDIGGFDRRQILRQHLRHGAPRHIRPFLRQAAVSQIPPRMLGIGEIDVADDIHDPPVGLLRQALVLAAVSSFHMEDRDVKTLCTDNGQAGVGIAQHQYRIRLQFDHSLVAGRDDVAHGLPKIRTHSIQIQLRIIEAQIPEKDPIQGIVVILTGMHQDRIKVFPAFFYYSGKSNDFRAGTDDDHQLDLAVVFPVAMLHIRSPTLFSCKGTDCLDHS